MTKRTPYTRKKEADTAANQKMIPFDELKARLLANPEVKAEYDALGQEYTAFRDRITAHKPRE